ncbi:hypothetical protein R83H12_00565 [Fibrobacteria bacterium R8-3-H12]
MAAIKKIRFSGANNEIHESIFVIEANDKGNTDMNTITTTGFYRVAGGSQSANHYPASSSTAWNLAVFSGGNGVIQMASYYSSSAGANKAWIRVGHSANSTADSPGAVTFPSASPYGWTELGASGGGSSIPNPLPTDMGGTGSQNINQAAYNLFQTSQPNSINYVYGEGGNGAGYRQTATFFGDILEQTYQTGTFIASTNSRVSSVYSGVIVKYASNKVDMHGIVNCSGYVAVASPQEGGNSGILLFTLPTGFRPKTTRRFSGTTTPFYDGSMDYICGWNGIINTNGNVNIDWAPHQAYNQSTTFFFDFTFMGPIQ